MNGLDFTLSICQAAREGLGEDSWCRAHARNVELYAAFDGCGGSGARKHDCYGGHSEAYMASRLCAGAFYDAFEDYFSERPEPARPHALLQRCTDYTQKTLAAHRPSAESGRRLVSSMITTLPTTAAAVVVRQTQTQLELTASWAGDSRVYLLSQAGLMQLTQDDSEESDPFETDGLMTNTLSADKPPRLHEKRVVTAKPAVVFAATDGCFAYYMSPMEFEHVLLDTLASADSAAAWEALLTQRFGKVAGDDYTLVGAAYGYGSFEALKAAMRPRLETLTAQYIAPLSQTALTDRSLRLRLWQTYRGAYMKYLGESSNG